MKIYDDYASHTNGLERGEKGCGENLQKFPKQGVNHFAERIMAFRKKPAVGVLGCL